MKDFSIKNQTNLSPTRADSALGLPKERQEADNIDTPVDNVDLDKYKDEIDNISQKDMKNISPKNLKDQMIGGAAGAGLTYLNFVTAGTHIHELGHYTAANILYSGVNDTIYSDRTENMKAFVNNSSSENFKRVLTDYNYDGKSSAGYYRMESNNGSSSLGAKLTENQRDALVNAGGSFVEDIPSFVAFEAGFQIRKNHPLAGYTLMSFGALNHAKVSMYPISALLERDASAAVNTTAVNSTLTVETADEALSGHDWVNFAENTGVNPALPAAAILLSLPAFAVGLYAIEKYEEGKIRDRIALDNLIQKGDLSIEDMENDFKDYDRKNSFKKAEDKVADKIGDIKLKGFPKDGFDAMMYGGVVSNLRKEYTKFSDYLIEKHKDKVSAERKIIDKQLKELAEKPIADMKNNLKEAWKKDKTGTLLSGSAIVSNTAVAAAAVSQPLIESILDVNFVNIKCYPQIAKAFTAGNAVLAQALPKLVPAAALVALTGSAYNAVKTLKDPQADKLHKFVSTGRAVFASIGAASLLVPTMAIPLVLASVAGQTALGVGEKIVREIKGDAEMLKHLAEEENSAEISADKK